MARARTTTDAGSWSGERFGPTCCPPIRRPASTSIATLIGTAKEWRTESTTSRWATSSTINVIAEAAPGEATSLPSAVRSTVG